MKFQWFFQFTLQCHEKCHVRVAGFGMAGFMMRPWQPLTSSPPNIGPTLMRISIFGHEVFQKAPPLAFIIPPNFLSSRLFTILSLAAMFPHVHLFFPMLAFEVLLIPMLAVEGYWSVHLSLCTGVFFWACRCTSPRPNLVQKWSCCPQVPPQLTSSACVVVLLSLIHIWRCRRRLRCRSRWSPYH